MSWQIARITAFNDNYIWALHQGQNAWVVDPGDALPVLEWLAASSCQLQGILLTHWHNDHQGGVNALLHVFPTIPVIGSLKPLNGPSSPVSDGDLIQVLGLDFQVHATPGHTLDHVCYVCTDPRLDAPIAFTGDTLFAGGCGRLFEGDAALMFSSLQRLNCYPGNTQIYCAHEYTVANLRFAVACEPHNSETLTRLQDAQTLVTLGQSTVPSTLGLERLTNPFLRADTAAELGRRRSWKDQF
jgi:hydroxyacylglutathione hydrolase